MNLNTINKPSILTSSKQMLLAEIQNWGEKPFRANQILDWLFAKRASSFSQMQNLSLALREKLQETFDFSFPTLVQRQDSEDGASKLLLKGTDGKIFETVILRYEDRTSLCVSSQVGCRLACSFCQTGKLGFFRHLSAHEILSQFLFANDIVTKEGRSITHVVFMGMGEPLDNFDNAVTATNTLIERYGLSAYKVTLSTSGIAPKIRELAQSSKASLALSLHASRDDLRTSLMPINRKYSLEELKQALTFYQQQTNRLITIEYILIKNVNCGIKEAKELVRFLHGLKTKVNLIRFNSHPGLDFHPPDDTDIRTFQAYLSTRGIPSPVRYSKGSEVSAACGQLAAKALNQTHLSPERKNVIQNSEYQNFLSNGTR